MQTLAQYKGGWSVIGEPDHTFIAVAYGEDQTIAPNLAWDLSAEDDTEDRDTMFGELLDVLVNGTLIAQGEVVVVNDKFGIRLTDIITPAERMRKISR